MTSLQCLVASTRTPAQLGGLFCVILGWGALLSAVDAALLDRWRVRQQQSANEARRSGVTESDQA